MTPGISDMSREIYSLHMLMFWWCVGIAIVVFGFMIYSMVHFRKSKGAVADQHFLHSTRVEIIWTLMPVLILISMAVPAARVLVRDRRPGRRPQLTIRVTGYQWKWGYEYVGYRRHHPVHAGPRQQSRAPARLRHRSVHGAELPARGRSPAGGAGRRQGAGADHRPGRDSFLVGAGAGDQEGCDPGLHQRGLVRYRCRTRSAPTAASAPSCAAATTASCRSCSRSRASRTSSSGSRRSRPHAAAAASPGQHRRPRHAAAAGSRPRASA